MSLILPAGSCGYHEGAEASLQQLERESSRGGSRVVEEAQEGLQARGGPGRNAEGLAPGNGEFTSDKSGR